jgi:hypothetical protein
MASLHRTCGLHGESNRAGGPVHARLCDPPPTGCPMRGESRTTADRALLNVVPCQRHTLTAVMRQRSVVASARLLSRTVDLCFVVFADTVSPMNNTVLCMQIPFPLFIHVYPCSSTKCSAQRRQHRADAPIWMHRNTLPVTTPMSVVGVLARVDKSFKTHGKYPSGHRPSGNCGRRFVHSEVTLPPNTRPRVQSTLVPTTPRGKQSPTWFST